MLHRTIQDQITHEPPPKRASVASVLPVFGKNLRLLTSARGTQAKVSSDLDIGRVQFQRYLRGESFPKPHALKKICDYFMVDARILTEPLTEDLQREMMLARNPSAQFVDRGAWMSALGFSASSQNYFGNRGPLDPGLYASWQWCGARKNTIVRRLFKVQRHEGVTVTRGYSPREFFPAGTPLKDREYRGICLTLRSQGYFLWSFFPKPSDMMATAFVTPASLSEDMSDVLVGYTAISRDELPGLPRLSRVIIEPISASPNSLLKQAHMPSFFKLEDVHPSYADLLSSPVA